MDTYRSIVHINRDDIYKDIVEDSETRFDTLKCKLEKPLPKRKTKKIIDLIKNELGEKIMKELVGLAAKTHSYLTDYKNVNKKTKGIIQVCHKKKTYT